MLERSVIPCPQGNQSSVCFDPVFGQSHTKVPSRGREILAMGKALPLDLRVGFSAQHRYARDAATIFVILLYPSHV